MRQEMRRPGCGELGNLTKSFESRLVILKDDVERCLVAVERKVRVGADGAPADALGRLRSHFRAEGWDLLPDEDGNVRQAHFVGEKLNGILLFEAAAPYVQPDSFIEFWQEYAEGPSDVPNTRWRFDGSILAWEDAMPPEQREAFNDRSRRSAAFQRENVAREGRGEPPLCGECFDEGREPRVLVPHPDAADPPEILRMRCPLDGFNILMKPASSGQGLTSTGPAVERVGLLRRFLRWLGGRSVREK